MQEPAGRRLPVFWYVDHSCPLAGNSSTAVFRCEVVRVESLGCTLSLSYASQQKQSRPFIHSLIGFMLPTSLATRNDSLKIKTVMYSNTVRNAACTNIWYYWYSSVKSCYFVLLSTTARHNMSFGIDVESMKFTNQDYVDNLALFVVVLTSCTAALFSLKHHHTYSHLTHKLKTPRYILY